MAKKTKGGKTNNERKSNENKTKPNQPKGNKVNDATVEQEKASQVTVKNSSQSKQQKNRTESLEKTSETVVKIDETKQLNQTEQQVDDKSMTVTEEREHQQLSRRQRKNRKNNKYGESQIGQAQSTTDDMETEKDLIHSEVKSDEDWACLKGPKQSKNEIKTKINNEKRDGERQIKDRNETVKTDGLSEELDGTSCKSSPAHVNVKQWKGKNEKEVTKEEKPGTSVDEPEKSNNLIFDAWNDTNIDKDISQSTTIDPYFHQQENRNFKKNFNKTHEKREDRPLYNKRQSHGDRDQDTWRSTNRSDDDKGFYQFTDLLKNKAFRDFTKVVEIEGDLFNMSTEYALAHCVAEDMSMGSGIAVQFSQQFKRRDELYAQKQKQGGLAILEDKGRYIYYLVTKRVSNGKPTLLTMWNSLQKLQNHIEEKKVKKLAIPRIGCGLDRLEWSDVKAMLEYTFKDTDCEITVCNFQQPEDNGNGNDRPSQKRNKSFVKNESYTITQIESGTAIIYFGTENGHVSKEIEMLDSKFRITMDYKMAKKNLGDVLVTSRHNDAYSLFGFIVTRTEKDEFDFIQFQKCINQFKKKCKDYYYYVAFQAFIYKPDDLLMSKIVNMLRSSLLKNEIYVCWGGDTISYMPQERQSY